MYCRHWRGAFPEYTCGVSIVRFISFLSVSRWAYPGISSSYVCEIAPPNKRGPLAATAQLISTLGLCLGFFICYGTVGIPSSLSWRLPLAFHSGIAFFLALASFFYLPQSPRWLAYKGRKEEASVAWDKLGVSGAEREKNLLQDPTSADDAVRVNSTAGYTEAKSPTLRDKASGNMRDLTAVFRGHARKPMLLGLFLMTMQQLSGIDGVIYVRDFPPLMTLSIMFR